MARYRWLRELYLQQNLEVSLPGCAFLDRRQQRIGQLEEIRLAQGRLHLRGWTLAESISIRLGAGQIARRPSEEREDVAAALGCSPQVGFRASLPFDEGAVLLVLDHQGDIITLHHDLPVRHALRKLRLRHSLAFWRHMLPILPMIAKGLIRKDPDLPRRVKAAFGFGRAECLSLLDARFFNARVPESETKKSAPKSLTIILPVYNAFELLPEVLARVVTHTDLPYRLIVIEDCSSDPAVRPWLRDWAAGQGADVELVENESNLGFIGSVNRGFELAQQRAGTEPVVLLNSDAMVPAGWASRLIRPLADPAVASATPLSNDAEIFSAPVICHRTMLAPGQGDAIDASLRAQITPQAPCATTPVGVGFCMALSRDWLARLGGFDPVFGRGYGEEVDWCRRAAAQGARHVAVPNLFVEHRGGASFGPEKRALVQQNNAVISKRYPGYDRMVQDFIRDDPLVTARLAAALAWAENRSDCAEIPVYIAHSMGGGAENYLQARLRTDPISVVLRFGGAFRVRIEFDSPEGRLTAHADDLSLLDALLRPLKKRRIIYSCAVGDPDLSEIPEILARLATGARLDVLFHDYLPLSPSYTLLDADGRYRGVPAPDCADPAHSFPRADAGKLTLADWRRVWSRALGMAERLVVFSQSSREIVAAAYPAFTDRIIVIPHKLPQKIPVLPAPATGRKVIGVLGAIGPQKGAAVVAALSDQLKTGSDIGLALIGRIAPGYPLSQEVAVHGAYAVEDIPLLAARYQITHWLIPSIWPETFSYTVHECLATGLPTLAFDLGAQGEAVRKAANGIVLPWQPEAESPQALARLVRAALDPAPTADSPGALRATIGVRAP